ncbi:MAG: protein BatD [Verrucomicrobiae bacterium]|nr:protein BatD [Verrucomicrobiae bacterium]
MMACITGLRLLAEPSLIAQLEPQEIPLGDSATLNLVFTDLGEVPAPPTPEVTGATIQYRGSSRNFSFINFKQSSSVTHQYVVTPKAQGAVSIPAITVEVGGRPYQTQPLILRVGAGRDLSRLGVLQLSAPRSEVYVGETFPVEVRFLFRVSPAQQAPPTLAMEGFLKGRQRMENLPPEKLNGHDHGVVRWTLAVTAIKPGEFEVGPAELQTLYRFDTGRGFFGGTEQRQITFNSEPLPLRVLNPPPAGRPAGYEGAVGRFRSEVRLSATNVAVGDPVTVRVRVSGAGNFDALRLPPLPSSAPFQVYPGTNSFAEGDPLGLTGTKTFELVLVPEESGLQTLNWPVWSSWDPDTRRYLTDAPGPLRIEVRQGATAQAQPSGSHVGPAPGSSSRPADSAADLALFADVGPLRRPGALMVSRAAYWCAWSFPLLAYATAGLAIWWRRRRTADTVGLARRRARQAIAEATTALAAHAAAGRVADFYAALNAALQEQLALLLGGVPGHFTEEVLEGPLEARGFSGTDAARLRRLFAAMAQARFAPGAASGELVENARDAAEVLAALEHLEESP